GKILARFKSTGCRVAFNGKEIQRRERDFGGFYEAEVDLAQGWNSITAKIVTSREADGNFNLDTASNYFYMVLYGSGKDEKYETDGILWSAKLPQAGPYMSSAQPVVVGDRIFVNTDSEFLTCYDKLTGRHLWTTFNGPSECATPKERAEHPEVFREVDSKVR